jgi:hypothetical protein
MLSVVVHTVSPATQEIGTGCRRIESSRPGQAKVMLRPCLKSKIKTKELGHNASGRILA